MFDIGVNLTSSQFAKDRDDVVARAFDAGVNGLLITGTNLRESQQAQKLARQYSSCWSTAGVHPHDSSQWQAATEEAIIELAAQPEVVAIGECGLDFNRNFSTPEEQERRLRDRIDDGRKIWKLSPMDIKSFNRWDEYTQARDAMFAATDTSWAPWFVARSEEKKRVRLNIITHLLSQIPYKSVHTEPVKLPKRKIGKVKPTKYPFRYVEERF